MDQMDSNSAAVFAALLPFIYFSIACSVIMIVSAWVIFAKAGQPGWAIFVPFYRLYIYAKIIGKPWTYYFWLLVPFYNIYIAIQLTHLLSKSFGKDAGFTAGLIFVGFIFYPILAFSKSIQYIGPGGVPQESLDANIGSIGQN